MEKYLLIIILIGIMPCFASYTLADDAPLAPPCAETSINDEKITPTCGFMKLNVQVNLDQYRDKFVFLSWKDTLNKEKTDADMLYSVRTGDVPIETAKRALNVYFAIDRDYFDSNGGIDGLFTVCRENCFDDPDIFMPIIPLVNYNSYMVPKNAAEFPTHMYTLLVPSTEFPDEDGTYTSSEYIELNPDFYPNRATLNTECNYENVCEKYIYYTPKSVSDHTILLVQDTPRTTYKPSTLKYTEVDPKRIDKNIPQKTTSTHTSEQTTSSAPVSVPPSFWTRFWNFITSLL